MTAFHNKSVLVLGGSRGIGAAIVRRFVADGASVRFSYSGSPEAAERLAAETGSTAVQADSADRDAVISLVRDSGPLDVLVVNAGIAIFGDAWSRTAMPSIACSASIFMPPTMPPWKQRAGCRKAGALLSSVRSMAIACRCREWRPMRSASQPCRGWRAVWHGILARAASRSTSSSPAQLIPMQPGERPDERADAQLYGH